ncbi:hypothetical protein BGX28_003160 [Mortierella sp. GBA30]|nr:hypothetical protein BGX28_003160 [Mortierella sp. GBA30]
MTTVSILINVPSITSSWVGISSYNETIHDWNDPVVLPNPRWLNITIVFALVMAIICNICVLFRFLERWIWHNVILSLITASLQDCLCIASVVPFCVLYPPSKGYVYLEGFWTMIASMVFSFTATVLMSIDLHTTPNFRLRGSGVTHKQRLLIAEAMALCFYLAIGALIFIYIEGWTFLDALFFVMVTITTIGFGDRVPVTTGGRTFVIFYASGGIVLLALAINAIRYVILEDLHRRFAIRAKERKAKRDARRQERKEQRARDEEKRLHLLETLQRIHQMETEQPQSEENMQASHYWTHVPRQFSHPIKNPLKLPALFTRSDGAILSESKDGCADSTSIERLKSQSDVLPRAATDERRQEDASVGASSEIAHREWTHRMGQGLGINNNRELELLRFATLQPQSSHDLKSLRYLLRRFWPFKHGVTEAAAEPRTLEQQREADKRQAYNESMQEYKRRLRFSAAMFLIFWLVGALIFALTETWTFGSSMYFAFIAFSTIGYGDFVPKTMAGRSVFLAYCLVGVVALTSLASLISEVLSKSMRRHVVEAQLRRTERRFEALEEGYIGQNDDRDLETGIQQLEVLSDGGQHRATSPDHGSQEPSEESEPSSASNSCEGSLQKLLRISQNFDWLLQKVLGLDYLENEDGYPKLGLKGKLPAPRNPEAIVDYLEKSEADSEPSYLSPSISRDITSTSTIQRHSLRPLLHRTHSHAGTYHGAGTCSPSSDSPQLKITAWPTMPGPQPDAGPVRSSSAASFNAKPEGSVPVFSSSHLHNTDGTITVAAVDWMQLIEYAKQFKALTLACEKALQEVAAWEVTEKKLRQRRCQARLRRKQLLEERRRRLGEHGAVDNGIEDEEFEELEEWDEEGSDEEDEDREQGRRRASIARDLLGIPSKPRRSRSWSRPRRRSRSQSEAMPTSNPQSPSRISTSLAPHFEDTVWGQALNPSMATRSGSHAKDREVHRRRRRHLRPREASVDVDDKDRTDIEPGGTFPTIALTTASPYPREEEPSFEEYRSSVARRRRSSSGAKLHASPPTSP